MGILAVVLKIYVIFLRFYACALILYKSYGEAGQSDTAGIEIRELSLAALPTIASEKRGQQVDLV